MSVLGSWLATPPPDAAIAIAPESVSVAALGGRGKELVVQHFASEPLPAGAVTASLIAQNIVDRPAVVAALRGALDRLGVRPRRVGLILPDLAARVSLLRFERIPPRIDDLEQLIRWQLKKSAPFPVDEAALTFTSGSKNTDGSTEFVVVLARQTVVREYESVCQELGAHPGLVDLSTLSIVNLLLAGHPAPQGDWLLVHVRPDYTSVVILRGADVIFFRHRPEGDEDALVDVVHQTTMYYQDRLSGQGFARVLIGGVGRTPEALMVARRSLEERLGIVVQPVDPTQVAALTDRIVASEETLATLAPLVGALMRDREAVGA